MKESEKISTHSKSSKEEKSETPSGNGKETKKKKSKKADPDGSVAPPRDDGSGSNAAHDVIKAKKEKKAKKPEATTIPASTEGTDAYPGTEDEESSTVKGKKKSSKSKPKLSVDDGPKPKSEAALKPKKTKKLEKTVDGERIEATNQAILGESSEPPPKEAKAGTESKADSAETLTKDELQTTKVEGAVKALKKKKSKVKPSTHTEEEAVSSALPAKGLKKKKSIAQPVVIETQITEPSETNDNKAEEKRKTKKKTIVNDGSGHTKEGSLHTEDDADAPADKKKKKLKNGSEHAKKEKKKKSKKEKSELALSEHTLGTVDTMAADEAEPHATPVEAEAPDSTSSEKEPPKTDPPMLVANTDVDTGDETGLELTQSAEAPKVTDPAEVSKETVSVPEATEGGSTVAFDTEAPGEKTTPVVKDSVEECKAETEVNMISGESVTSSQEDSVPGETLKSELPETHAESELEGETMKPNASPVVKADTEDGNEAPVITRSSGDAEPEFNEEIKEETVQCGSLSNDSTAPLVNIPDEPITKPESVAQADIVQSVSDASSDPSGTTKKDDMIDMETKSKDDDAVVRAESISPNEESELSQLTKEDNGQGGSEAKGAENVDSGAPQIEVLTEEQTRAEERGAASADSDLLVRDGKLEDAATTEKGETSDMKTTTKKEEATAYTRSSNGDEETKLSQEPKAEVELVGSVAKDSGTVDSMTGGEMASRDKSHAAETDSPVVNSDQLISDRLLEEITTAVQDENVEMTTMEMDGSTIPKVSAPTESEILDQQQKAKSNEGAVESSTASDFSETFHAEPDDQSTSHDFRAELAAESVQTTSAEETTDAEPEEIEATKSNFSPHEEDQSPSSGERVPDPASGVVAEGAGLIRDIVEETIVEQNAAETSTSADAPTTMEATELKVAIQEMSTTMVVEQQSVRMMKVAGDSEAAGSTTTTSSRVERTKQNTVVILASSPPAVPEDVTKELEELRRNLLVTSQEKAELQEKLSQREHELMKSQDLVLTLEGEIEKQLKDWEQMEKKMLEADNQIKVLMKDAQEIGGLKAKIAEYEKLKTELDDANMALSELKQKVSPAAAGPAQTSSSVADDVKVGLEIKLSEKDKIIAFLHEELGRHRIGGAPKIEISDFSSLNASLARFSAEISSAKSEIEEAQKKMSMM